ncbi:hypothetical protein [Desertivibrio insolitus]|uniref:hypothetical protein n=1 Tax=Herbiconiux sp. SYSU D00978 TaxID=2812562 RepID=UPI001A967F81|nr:hypothetical protein [Herbiconiux sp. SYSU D00978]
MYRVSYANGDFFTDDRIALALIKYANVLAIVDSADVVEIPGVDTDGKVRRIHLIIGPASQIVMMETDLDHVELPVDEAVHNLARRARQRLPSSEGIGDFGLDPADPAATTQPGEQ